MNLALASFGAYSLSGKRHPNEDRWVAFSQLNLCPSISTPAWQLKKKKKKKKGEATKEGAGEQEAEKEEGYLPLSFFAVYDGHGGSLCVETVCTRLHKYIINQRTRALFFLRDPELINDTLIREAIRRGFEDMDKEVIRTTEQKGDASGSCAVVVIILYNRLFIAHAGDTRAVLGQLKRATRRGTHSESVTPVPARLYGELKKTHSENSLHAPLGQHGVMSHKSTDAVTTPRRREQRISEDEERRSEKYQLKLARRTIKNLRTVDLTEDHKAMSEKEKKRMKLKGGFVVNGRVFGILAVARAFGDRALKMSPKEYQIRKIKGPDTAKRSREVEVLSEGSDDSSDDENGGDDGNGDGDDDDDAKGKARSLSEADAPNGNRGDGDTSLVDTDASSGTSVATRKGSGSKSMNGAAAQRRQQNTSQQQRLPQRGQDFNMGLPFENDELWGWVEAHPVKSNDEEEEKERKKKKKEERAKAKAEAWAEKKDGKSGENGAGEDEDKKEEQEEEEDEEEEKGDGKEEEGTGDASPSAKKEQEKGKKGKKDGKDNKKDKSYEAMTEKEMKRRQDKALKKRSKQLKKEKEQLKEKERKVKEMAKIQERRGNAGEGVVVASPDISCRIISPEDRFVLIASDGLWDVCPSKEAVKAVSQFYLEEAQLMPPLHSTAAQEVSAAPSSSSSGPAPGTQVGVLRNICEAICRTARKGGSTDDITCMLIALHPNVVL